MLNLRSQLIMKNSTPPSSALDSPYIIDDRLTSGQSNKTQITLPANKEAAINKKIISPIETIIQDIRKGKMVILIDEEDRENEGDIVIAADFVTPEVINFMAKYARGLICLTLTEEKCKQLQLPLMVHKGHNGAQHSTNFTLSIEAAQGVTTGISAQDRATTIKAAIHRHAKPTDIVQPGHIFPLMAKNGGVLMRAGHTEAGCDLAELAGLGPFAVICEIMNDDGTMARLPDLVEFAKVHHLNIGTIADLIEYRSHHESIIEKLHSKLITTPYGAFHAHLFKDIPSQNIHLALVNGHPNPEKETLVRVHEPLSFIDFLNVDSQHSWSLPRAIKICARHSPSVLVLLNCEEERNQFAQRFMDSLDYSSKPIHKKIDLRTYGVGAQILTNLGVGKMCLMAHPRKIPSMAGYGLETVRYYEEFIA